MQKDAFAAVDAELLSALAEANRLRIVELLNLGPRSVGEVAAEVGLRQPQATKHLQTLERAGLVTMHPVGQRRIYALRRESLRPLRGWLEGLEPVHPSEAVLERHAAAIEAERDRAERDPEWAVGRTTRFARSLPAPVDQVWAHWTSAALVRRWWSPEHFTVAECEVEAVVDGPLRVVMQEGDGTRYLARGRFLALAPSTHLSFEMSHIGSDDRALFTAVHDVRLDPRGDGTQLVLVVHVTEAGPAATTALAGLELGWEQILGKLTRALGGDDDGLAPRQSRSSGEIGT
ncbi:MAG: metalloregulator ArsR/SmtB family transcription factor [Solirubrobacteraceae bacterium]